MSERPDGRGAGRAWSVIAAGLAGGSAAGRALAQTLDLDPNLPTLPKAPAYQVYLFESPWAGVAVGVVGGVILAEWFRRRAKGRAALVSLLVGLALAAGVWASTSLVETRRERVGRAARTLIAAAGMPDGPRLRVMLDPRVVVQTALGRGEGADQVADLAERHVPGFAITDLRVPEVRAALFGGDIAQTQVHVRLKSDRVPQNSWWRIDWARDPSAPPDDPQGGWRATRIEPLWILGVPNPAG